MMWTYALFQNFLPLWNNIQVILLAALSPKLSQSHKEQEEQGVPAQMVWLSQKQFKATEKLCKYNK